MRESNRESDEENVNQEEDDEEEEEFQMDRHRHEIYNRVTRPLSASSTGSMPAAERPPEREFNPFVKAISSQRKDFSFVTQLRKEVIQIIEPFRNKVLTFDERLVLLEKAMTETQDLISDNEAKNTHRMNQMVTLTRLKQSQETWLQTLYEQVKKIEERINQITEANEIMTIKLKHGEEFSRSFKAVMESSKIEREEQVINLESYKEKIFADIVEAKREIAKIIEGNKMEMNKLRYSLNKQHGMNTLTEKNFDMYQRIVVDAVSEAKAVKQEYEEKLEQMLEQSSIDQKKKMFEFCDILVREFKYMNKLQEDKILYEIGFNEKRIYKHNAGTEPWQLYNEIIEPKTESVFSQLSEKDKKAIKRRRANSIHTFEPPKIKKPNPVAIERKRKEQEEREKLEQELGSAAGSQSEGKQQDDNVKESPKIIVQDAELEEVEEASATETLRSMITVPRDEVFTLDFALENAWQRSFKRMKRAVAASEGGN